MKKVLQEKIAELGRMTVHEIQVKHSALYLRLGFSSMHAITGLVLLHLTGTPLVVQRPKVHQGMGKLCEISVSHDSKTTITLLSSLRLFQL